MDAEEIRTINDLCSLSKRRGIHEFKNGRKNKNKEHKNMIFTKKPRISNSKILDFCVRYESYYNQFTILR